MASSADLGEKLEAVVKDLVANGRYNSKSEVLREGVRLVQEREAALRRGGFREISPEAPLVDDNEEFWKDLEANFVPRKRKTSVHLRLDPDVVELFRSDGPGHLTRMANVLKAYADSRRR